MGKPKRELQRTIHIVGEGYAEVHFLRRVRHLYLSRQGNLNLKVGNARGKGGRAVLDYALRPQIMAGYDVVATLVDTDEGWDDEQRKRARSRNVVVIESTPCLEALRLEIHGPTKVRGTTHCKREFKKRFGTTAHDLRVYEQHFSTQQLDAARRRGRALDQLLTLLGI